MKKIFILMSVIGATMLASCGNGKKADTVATEAQTAVSGTDSVLINTQNSTIQWRGFKPGGEHYGVISLKSGAVYMEDGKLVGGRFVIDMNSIDCKDLTADSGKEQLEGHLKSADFFNVANYPEATFSITSVTEQLTDSTTHAISGNLTMLGVEKNITFGATVNATAGTAKSVTFTIDRTQWGIQYKSKSILASLKDGFINDEIELTVALEAVKE